MSNYSVKLTKCGKCQFSLAHLPSGGGERVADLCADLRADPTGTWPPGAGAGPAQGQRPLGWVAAGAGPGGGAPGTPAGWWGSLG